VYSRPAMSFIEAAARASSIGRPQIRPLSANAY